MSDQIKLLSKQIFSYLEILIVIDFKIYYLKIKPYDDFFAIEQIYLLEEIPNKKELIQRLNYYVSHEQYSYVSRQLARDYLVKIQNFIDLFLHNMRKKEIKHFENLYDGEYHPDLLDLKALISL